MAFPFFPVDGLHFFFAGLLPSSNVSVEFGFESECRYLPYPDVRVGFHIFRCGVCYFTYDQKQNLHRAGMRKNAFGEVAWIGTRVR